MLGSQPQTPFPVIRSAVNNWPLGHGPCVYSWKIWKDWPFKNNLRHLLSLPYQQNSKPVCNFCRQADYRFLPFRNPMTGAVNLIYVVKSLEGIFGSCASQTKELCWGIFDKKIILHTFLWFAVWGHNFIKLLRCLSTLLRWLIFPPTIRVLYPVADLVVVLNHFLLFTW